jgi:hypothetical protein
MTGGKASAGFVRRYFVSSAGKQPPNPNFTEIFTPCIRQTRVSKCVCAQNEGWVRQGHIPIYLCVSAFKPLCDFLHAPRILLSPQSINSSSKDI